MTFASCFAFPRSANPPAASIRRSEAARPWPRDTLFAPLPIRAVDRASPRRESHTRIKRWIGSTPKAVPNRSPRSPRARSGCRGVFPGSSNHESPVRPRRAQFLHGRRAGRDRPVSGRLPAGAGLASGRDRCGDDARRHRRHAGDLTRRRPGGCHPAQARPDRGGGARHHARLPGAVDIAAALGGGRLAGVHRAGRRGARPRRARHDARHGQRTRLRSAVRTQPGGQSRGQRGRGGAVGLARLAFRIRRRIRAGRRVCRAGDRHHLADPARGDRP